ncbi:4Fe-4S binding protein [Phocea massiliensis]|jgi:pyruvate ferredoxin oxidoreductase delta subunit|uniref:Pyruvate synthase subunit PorD n=1 Tax=uncultured Anaerotruncus sp. TaxID=905011 RepID=A0A6N2UBZ9_9FIRM|nr:4Fe-4S dicluster domain-containing protein [Merdimmobilis hominis]MCD4835360.1 4Fe-4S binding protein [Merdimmobilis hominis]
MAKENLMKDIHEKSAYAELTPGGDIYGSGNSRFFNTGEWRTATPVFVPENCKQCLLCVPVCPDSAIPVVDGKRGDFDYDHCKGCGICFKVCPFKAITFNKD